MLVRQTCDQGKMPIRASQHTHHQLPYVAQAACQQLRYTGIDRHTSSVSTHNGHVTYAHITSVHSQLNGLPQQLPVLAAMTHLPIGLEMYGYLHTLNSHTSCGL